MEVSGSCFPSIFLALSLLVLRLPSDILSACRSCGFHCQRLWDSIHLWVNACHWLPRGKPVVLDTHTHSNAHHSSMTDRLYLRNKRLQRKPQAKADSGASWMAIVTGMDHLHGSKRKPPTPYTFTSSTNSVQGVGNSIDKFNMCA